MTTPHGTEMKIIEDNLPFVIKLDTLDLTLTKVHCEYPQYLIPENLKKSSGKKAKLLKYEEIDPDMYLSKAKMVAFKVRRERLEPWIRALMILYFDYYGNDETYDLEWHDEPEEWLPEGNKSICIDLNKDDQLLYKVTFFINTGLIQAQGLSRYLFATNDFPVLKALVDNICVVNDKDSCTILSTEEVTYDSCSSGSNSCSETELKEILNETIVEKSTIETDMKQVIHVISDTNFKNNTEATKITDSCDIKQTDTKHTKTDPNRKTHFDNKSAPKLKTHTDIRSDEQPNCNKVSEQVEILQTAFTEALSTMNKSQSGLLKQIGIDFSKSIEKSLVPVVDNLNKQLQAVQQLSDNICKNYKKDETKTVKQPEVVKLKEHIKSLQDENLVLKTDKYETALQIAKIESRLESEKVRSETTHKKLELTLENIKEENENLREKLRIRNMEADKVTSEQKELKTKCDAQFDEILSLKSQISNCLSTEQDVPLMNNSQSRNTKVKSRKPTALLVGTSNANYIKPNALSQAVDVKKGTAFTFVETEKVIRNDHSNPDAILLHSLTNEIKTKSPEQCVEELDSLVEMISSKWRNTKTIISLTTPRNDCDEISANCEILDALIKRKYLNNKDVIISDNYNMWHNNTPTRQLLKQDKFHLTAKGASILASNMKSVLHKTLNIQEHSNHTSNYIKPTPRQQFHGSYNYNFPIARRYSDYGDNLHGW